ncbi:MAG TPA: N-acetyltransferase [Paenibacillus sp.]|uniref:GNAT family N-acetyltransferase n=1 Tax=Paenibacillus vandeheii TaxID=3035917 RepID=A0ABT8JDN9_9BACL|nr:MULTISPECIES: GNAT family N-acetyltransferase [Paenibacillus]MDN4603221.1 GNAT family N-acetyltransferase [Paenibacillus vandeheii]OZQ67076.1 GNAT family N-acetyltransferase [Paenibacillus taichungensis]HBU81628.1 N-acetyltransferase [Paenibacillus sp.]
MTEEKMDIRWANANDAEDLLKLNDAFNGVGTSVDEVKDSLALSDELIALAVINDQAVGFACAQYFKSFCYRGFLGEITEMYITEVARRRGLATLLISFIEDELRARGVTNMKILTGQRNEMAIKTYEKSNYEKTEEVLLQKKL